MLLFPPSAPMSPRGFPVFFKDPFNFFCVQKLFFSHPIPPSLCLFSVDILVLGTPWFPFALRPPGHIFSFAHYSCPLRGSFSYIPASYLTWSLLLFFASSAFDSGVFEQRPQVTISRWDPHFPHGFLFFCAAHTPSVSTPTRRALSPPLFSLVRSGRGHPPSDLAGPIVGPATCFF